MSVSTSNVNSLLNSIGTYMTTTKNKVRNTTNSWLNKNVTKKTTNTKKPTTTTRTTAPATTTPAQTVPVQTEPVPMAQQVKAPESKPYQASPAVQNALQMLQQQEAAKPQGYQSKYGDQMDALMAKIQNPEKFKYEFNGDELFKYYADLYTQKGRQASMDAMGQAAALTGGYGNSYAQQAGMQAYDEYLQGLYDRGMDLRNEAYQQYLNDQQDQYNRYNLLAQQDTSDYGRYRDTLGDWQNQRDYLAGRYDTERNFDYGQWNDQRQFEETQRQFDEQLNFNKMSEQQKYAYNYVSQMLANGQLPSSELLQQAGLSAADAQKLLAKATAGGGGGGRGRGSGTNDDIFYVDNDGKYYVYTQDKNGEYVRVNVDRTQVPSTAKVHNEYEEGGKRRSTNR